MACIKTAARSTNDYCMRDQVEVQKGSSRESGVIWPRGGAPWSLPRLFGVPLNERRTDRNIAQTGFVCGGSAQASETRGLLFEICFAEKFPNEQPIASIRKDRGDHTRRGSCRVEHRDANVTIQPMVANIMAACSVLCPPIDPLRTASSRGSLAPGKPPASSLPVRPAVAMNNGHLWFFPQIRPSM